jgi:hypothetical protein
MMIENHALTATNVARQKQRLLRMLTQVHDFVDGAGLLPRKTVAR